MLTIAVCNALIWLKSLVVLLIRLSLRVVLVTLIILVIVVLLRRPLAPIILIVVPSWRVISLFTIRDVTSFTILANVFTRALVRVCPTFWSDVSWLIAQIAHNGCLIVALSNHVVAWPLGCSVSTIRLL